MPWRGWWVLVVCLVASLATGAASMVYANRAAAESERKWCVLLVLLDEAYSSTPAQTELGRRVAEAVSQLRDGFACP